MTEEGEPLIMQRYTDIELMTLTSKFNKDISTLRAAANKEIFLDVKYPKLYKKVKRYYESLQYIDLKGEDPDADYNAVIECIIEDLNQ